MNNELIRDICTNLRPLIKSKVDGALKTIHLTIEHKQIDQVMIELMAYTQWVRVDLELLLRAALWLNLSEAEMEGRIAADQNDMLQTFKKRTTAQSERLDNVANQAQTVQANSPYTNKKAENNAEILMNEIWHKNELKELYTHFHSMLSKFAHPDPYFVFFPERLFYQVREFIVPMFSACAAEIHNQWRSLEKEATKLNSESN